MTNEVQQIPDATPTPEIQKYEGLGGWLILVAFGFIVLPCRYAYSLYNDFLPLFAHDKWATLTDPTATFYSALLGPLIIGEAVGNTVFALWCVVLLFLFFGRKSVFPKVVIVYLAANYAFVVADYILAQRIPLIAQQNNQDALNEIYRGGVVCCVWIPYFLVSKRVKATFTR